MTSSFPPVSSQLLEILQDDGAIAESRIAVGGAEAAPRRIVEAEYALKGRQPSSDAFMLAAEIAAKKVDPLDDENISAGYRRDLQSDKLCQFADRRTLLRD